MSDPRHFRVWRERWYPESKWKQSGPSGGMQGATNEGASLYALSAHLRHRLRSIPLSQLAAERDAALDRRDFRAAELIAAEHDRRWTCMVRDCGGEG